MLTRTNSIRAMSRMLCLVTAIGASNASAEVVHHWRFEEGPNVYQDSVGNAHLEVTGGEDIEAITFPQNRRGIAFPSSFAGLGSNTTGALFTSEIEELVAENSTLGISDFTVELFANVDNFSDAGTIVHLVSVASPVVAPTETFWSFQIRTTNDNNWNYGELNLNFGGNTQWHGTPSGIVIDQNTDYYLSANFDLQTREVTYYVQDLDDRSLRISHAPYIQDQLQVSDEILIGDVTANCACRTDGVIDEVRIANEVLNHAETLVSQATFDDVDYSAIESITLGPRDIYRLTDTRTIDNRLFSRETIRDTRKNLAKFALPDFVNPQELESATLRVFIESATEGSELGLWHSVTDNDFTRTSENFSNPSYVDTQKKVFTEGSNVGTYIDVDVTAQILQDLRQDPTDSVAAFRFDPSQDAQLRMSMPRNAYQQPLLVLALRPESLADFDRDGVLDADDINLLTAAIGTNELQYDLDGNDVVDEADHMIWITDFKQTWLGDANLDGEFSSTDLVVVFQHGKYERQAPAGWSEGDWNGDGIFSGGDFVAAFKDGGFEQGRRAAHAVPESASLLPVFLCLGALTRHRNSFAMRTR